MREHGIPGVFICLGQLTDYFPNRPRPISLVAAFLVRPAWVISIGWKSWTAKVAVARAGLEDEVAVMLHTSGTTSNSKRVMLTHSNLINNVESNIQSLALTEKDKVLIAMPMYFGCCNTAQFLTHLYLGATMVLHKGLFLPKSFFQTVEIEWITNFTGVPSMLLMLLEYRYIYKYDIKSLRYLCFGGGNMR